MDAGPDGLNPINTFIEYKYMIVGEHTRWGDQGTTAANHKNEQFLSWHRAYIGKLEQYLLDEGYPTYVPLPAWDPTTPLPIEFYNQMIPEYKTRGLDTPGNNAQAFGEHLFLSDQMDTWAPNPTFGDPCNDYLDADDLGNSLVSSAIHVPVHFEMGGPMTSQASTSGATAFWPLHANIDENYYCYQLECQCPIIDVVGTSANCEYCLDLDDSVNTDTHEVILVDNIGNESIIQLDVNVCFSTNDLTINATYSLMIKAINTGMADNIDCPEDEIVISFKVPSPSKFNPCVGIILTPTNSNLTEFSFIGTTGTNTYYNFYNTPATTGTPNLVASNVLVSSGVESVITVPASMIQPGINYFTAEGNGEVVSYEYICQ